MKTKNLLYLFLSLGIFAGCTPEEGKVLDFSELEIAKIELGADARQLIADGVSTLTLNPMLYQKCTSQTIEGERNEVYGRIPVDRIAEGTVRYFLEDGTELDGPEYRTTDVSQGELGFYIMVNDMKSEVFTVKLRKPFAEDEFETITYPIVFHVVQSEESIGRGQKLGSDLIYEFSNAISTVFERKSALVPNGANSRIRFQLAEYDQNGLKMQEKGINRVTLNAGDMDFMMKDYVGEITGYQSKKLLWDYKKYLNIWIIEGINASVAAPPTYILSGTEPLEGIPAMQEKTEEEFENVDWSIYDIGLVFDGVSFSSGDGLMCGQIGQVGMFFGLLSTREEIEGVSDYCDDTMPYEIYTEPWYDENGNDANARLKISDDGLLFYSTNIMDYASFRTTITMDQVKRIRTITDNCPLRWAWKSKWAFTGKED